MFYLGDHLESPVLRLDATGKSMGETAYHPYGAPRHESGGAGDPFGYVGNERDRGAGLSDFKARPYRPELGIFLAPDPVAVFEVERALEEPQRLAAYAYSGGDPISGADPGGQFWAAVAAVVETAVDVAFVVHDAKAYAEDPSVLNAVALGVSVASVAIPGLNAAAGKAGLKIATELIPKGALLAKTKHSAQAGLKTAQQASTQGGTGAARGAHGNSRLSTKAQHGYEIADATTGEVVKTGVSGGSRTATGGSARANSQANRWNREAGQPGRYEPRVVQEVPAGPGARQQVLDWEADNAARLREAGHLTDESKHVRP